MPPNLSIIIPCKDERHNIGDCIDSVRSIADEILVFDSGSTDGTVDLVRQTDGCRLVEREWMGYAKFKNWAIPQAKNPWVLLLDADERVTPELADEISRTLAHVDDRIDGFWIRRRNYFQGQPICFSGWRGDKVCRLIRRDRCRYRDVAVHEEIDIAPDRAGRLTHRLLHFTHATYNQTLDKTVRYTELSAEESYRRGRRPSFLRLLTAAPLRFLRSYLLKGGVLDGAAGLQVCMMTAFYAYLKEARLFELKRMGLPADGGSESGSTAAANNRLFDAQPQAPASMLEPAPAAGR